MTRSLEDAAIVLSIISGQDPNDPATLSQPPHVPDFTKALQRDALRGKRIGVPRYVFMAQRTENVDSFVSEAFEGALDILRGLGAEVVDPADLPSADEISKSPHELFVMETDLKVLDSLGGPRR